MVDKLGYRGLVAEVGPKYWTVLVKFEVLLMMHFAVRYLDFHYRVRAVLKSHDLEWN